MEYTLYHHGTKGMKWGIRRYQNKDGSLTPAGRKRQAKNEVHEDYAKAHTKKSIKQMSNTELKETNKRLEAEANYKRLTQTANRGEKAVKSFISTAGTISAAIAAYGTYKTLTNQGLDKIGDWVVKSIDLSGPLTK